MSSPEVEKFEVTDYDLENEFNPDRPTFRQTKKQALYGMWANSDDEDDGRRASKSKKNYTAPVSFISGGLKKAAEDEEAGDEVDDEDIGNVQEFARKMYRESKAKPDRRRARGESSRTGHDIGTWEKYTKGIGKKLLEKMGHKVGKGLGKNEQGIATPVEAVQRKGRGAIGLYGSERNEQSKKDFPVHDSEEEEDKTFKQQLQQWRVTDKAGKKKPQYIFKTLDEVLTKGERRSRGEQPSEMSKVKVIDMTGKEQRVLSGYHAISKRHDRPDSDGEDVVGGGRGGRSASAYGDGGTGQPRAFDMPELMHNLNILVDMTEEEIIQRGRQLRYEKDMVVNMQHEHERLAAICEQEEMMLARLSAVLGIVEALEARAKSHDVVKGSEQSSAVAAAAGGVSSAAADAGSPTAAAAAEPAAAGVDTSAASAAGRGSPAAGTNLAAPAVEEEVGGEEQPVSIRGAYPAATAAPPLDLDECAAMFKRLQDEYYEEYKMYDLAALTVAIVSPLVKKYFASWSPIANPSYGLQAVKVWKDILDEGQHVGQTAYGGQMISLENMDAYQRLMWDAWMPCIRVAVSQWDSRKAEALLEVIETWMPLLPTWMTQNILEQLVLPRLQVEVEDWNPLTDTVPIHAWLHPWLPHLGSRLESLYAPIRHKLASALTSWHPSDISAKLMLQPWVGVFSHGHMDAFLLKNIVPKLAAGLQELTINPHQQRLDQWNWVFAWQDMLADQPIVAMLEKHFFPRWLQTLAAWLSSSSPNYEEITKWYTGWKLLLPDRFLAHPTIKDQLNRALNVMNRAASGTLGLSPPLPQPAAPVSAASSAYYHGSVAPPPPPPQSMGHHMADIHASGGWAGGGGVGVMSRTPSMSVPHNFKDMLENKAAELNIIFLPVPGRTYEARQVYRFGPLLICLDRGVIFALDGGGQWMPVSVNALLERVMQRL